MVSTEQAKADELATDSQNQQNPGALRLVDQISKVLIIAYRESTQVLEAALVKEGFECEVVRQIDREELRGSSPSYLCMLNHQRAWQQASEAEQPTLIVEADFVPVEGMGKLPVPYEPDDQNMGITWLYTCAPQIYSVSERGYARGFSTAMVAYILTPRSAGALVEMVEEIRATSGANAYTTWDSQVEGFLRARRFRNYIPFRNYGEHGGRPNPEHRQNGLSAVHRADVLYGKLAFLPPYAVQEDGKGNQLQLLTARLQARLKGIARLARGRFLRFKIVRTSSVPSRLIGFALRRQLSPWL
ncbi:LPS biosynthesis glycosyltransferase [Oculatella sp. FACHB-28]|uniref:LPS biosynthesis glycosyltransferase n=1 Tax=Oculatella sp. FACHB-28 TaxID=2692845 RepID=UPI0018EF9895|nr:LPS biosynthesis glycosyltransferase [Oculatella sp. FACHB-28]